MKWQLPLLPNVLNLIYHHLSKNRLLVWHWKYYKALRCHCKNPWNVAWNFWHSSPRWREVSDPIQTNSIDRLWTQPYHFTMRKSWLFLSWLVGQFEFENDCFVSWCLKESTVRTFLTTITLDKNWLSSKFHLVLCVEHQFLKINFVSREIQKEIFLWRQQPCIQFHGGSSNRILQWTSHNGRGIDL